MNTMPNMAMPPQTMPGMMPVGIISTLRARSLPTPDPLERMRLTPGEMFSFFELIVVVTESSSDTAGRHGTAWYDAASTVAHGSDESSGSADTTTNDVCKSSMVGRC